MSYTHSMRNIALLRQALSLLYALTISWTFNIVLVGHCIAHIFRGLVTIPLFALSVHNLFIFVPSTCIVSRICCEELSLVWVRIWKDKQRTAKMSCTRLITIWHFLFCSVRRIMDAHVDVSSPTEINYMHALFVAPHIACNDLWNKGFQRKTMCHPPLVE